MDTNGCALDDTNIYYPANPLTYPLISDQYAVQYKLGNGGWSNAPVHISKSSVNNAEECIAINPANPANLFASETWSLMTRYSLDGGITWTDSHLSALPSSEGDVTAAFDMFGNLFFAYLGSASSKGVVCVSTNGGATFSLCFKLPATPTNPR